MSGSAGQQASSGQVAAQSQPGASANQATSTSGLDGFSPEASRSLGLKSIRYEVDLEKLSRQKAKQSGDDIVTKRHVEVASRYLGSSPGRSYMGTIGGVFAGGGVSQFITMYASNSYAERGVIITIIAIAIGAVMIGVHLARE